MVIVLLRSKLVANPEGYAAMSDEMDVLARTMPGFIDVTEAARPDVHSRRHYSAATGPVAEHRRTWRWVELTTS
jgi:hypothetical protein